MRLRGAGGVVNGFAAADASPSNLDISAGFIWVDPRGEICNLYSERLSSENLGFDDSRAATGIRESFLACAEAPDGIVALCGGSSAIDHAPLAPLGARHALLALVRSGPAALGLLCVHRMSRAHAFTNCERAELASVMHYVAQGVEAKEARTGGDQIAFAYEDSEEEGLLVTDSAGTIRIASDNGLHLLLLATASEITPPLLKSTMGEGATRAVRALCARLDAAARGLERASPSITLDSKWGRFVLHGYRLCDDRDGMATIGLRIQRQVPMILRFVNAMGRQPLSPQQREIALQIALERSNAEISKLLGVSPNTVAYHVKQLFIRLNVHSRAEAIEKIAWGKVAATAAPQLVEHERSTEALRPAVIAR